MSRVKLEFRLATLVLESIERKRISFDKAYNRTLRKKFEKKEGFLYNVYELAWNSILKSYLADYIYSEVFKGRKLNIRRQCALRVAFYLVAYNRMNPETLAMYSGGLIKKELLSFLRMVYREDVEGIVADLPFDRKLSILNSYPLTLINSLSRFMKKRELEKFVKSQNRKTMWLRVNTVKIDVDKAIRSLEKEGVYVSQDKDYPYLLKITQCRKIVGNIRLVKDFRVIPMDKASAVVVNVLSPSRGELILDATAAPGIKSSLILQLTEDKARVIAVDLSRNRLYQMHKIINKLGVKNIDILLSDARKVKIRNVDKVLIDAPCSNSGAIRRDPALRLILKSKPKLYEHVASQRSILDNIVNNIRFRFGVYATCSVIPEEGEKQIARLSDILNIVKVKSIGLEGYRGYLNYDKFSRLFPHTHDTDGFFIAKFKGR